MPSSSSLPSSVTPSSGATTATTAHATRHAASVTTSRRAVTRLREQHAPRLAARQLIEAPAGELLDVTRAHRGGRGLEIGGRREPQATLVRVAAEQHDLFDREWERELDLLRQVREIARDHPARR